MVEAGPRTYIIGIIVFVLFIAGGMSILGMFSINTPQTTQFNSTFDKMNDVTAVASDLQGDITDAQPDQGVLGVLNGLISSAWQSLRLIFASLSFMTQAFRGMEFIFGVPGWIIGLLLAGIAIMLSFAIWSAIFQRDL